MALIDTNSLTPKRISPGEVLTPSRSALIIVDMMNRFCDPEWQSDNDPKRAAWLNVELRDAIPGIRKALDGFRKANGLVVHVVNARWTTDGREVVRYQRGRDYELFDSEAMSVIDELAPIPGEVIVRKVASSAFTGTGLDFLLNNAGIENVVLCGQWGNACVFYSLIQSREFGFNNYWLEDGILYSSETFKQLFPALVGSSWARLAVAEETQRALGITATS